MHDLKKNQQLSNETVISIIYPYLFEFLVGLFDSDILSNYLRKKQLKKLHKSNNTNGR